MKINTPKYERKDYPTTKQKRRLRSRTKNTPKNGEKDEIWNEG